MARVAISLVDRCVDVIDLLARTADGLPLGEISAKLELPKSATHRLLAALCARGWVDQHGQAGFYRLTLRLALLGQRYLLSTGIPDLCHPVLQALAEETQELVRLAVADGERLYWLDAVHGCSRGLVYQPAPVRDVALHVTAAGKAWLSSLPNEHALRIVLDGGFGETGKYGPRAIRTVEALMTALDDIRERGWAVGIEEAEAGIAGVAATVSLRPTALDSAPERTADGRVAVASLAIEFPVARCTEQRLQAFGTLVVRAAQELAELWPLRVLPPTAEMRLAS